MSGRTPSTSKPEAYSVTKRKRLTCAAQQLSPESSRLHIRPFITTDHVPDLMRSYEDPGFSIHTNHAKAVAT